MNAGCSLITHRIEVLPKKRLRLYNWTCLTGTPDLAQLDLNTGICDVTVDAVATEDGWLIIPECGGLPVRKIPGKYSLEEALEYEVIEIRKKTATGYVPVDEVGEM